MEPFYTNIDRFGGLIKSLSMNFFLSPLLESA
jgi:hypothetical protein